MSSHHPVITAAFWRRPGAVKGAEGDDIHEIDVHEIDARSQIAAYPGPAILFGAGGRVLAANGGAPRLLKALAADAAKDLLVLLAGVGATGRPADGQIFLPFDPVTGEAPALFYLTAIALAPKNRSASQLRPEDRSVMVLARDGSAEYAMRNALIESRDLYRDLSRCSSDFSWQTDDNGAFTFVSAKGALGFSAQALNGRRSQDLLNLTANHPDINPFFVRSPVENIEIALNSANGDTRYCRVDALPVYDKKNQWRGARGVCTDITDTKLHQQALEFMRLRETKVRAIVDATHRTLDPAEAFADAASILAQEAGAIHCAILTLDNFGRIYELGFSRSNIGPLDPPDKISLGLEEKLEQDTNSAQPINFTDGGRHNQIMFTSHGGKPNGVIWLIFSGDRKPPASSPPSKPDAAARSLVESVASHIGIAIAHDKQMRRLAELSRTDELTGLLNRRAFMKEMSLRHAHLYRTGNKCALLYIDLDNFKQVNDRLGHAAGDQVLKRFSFILQNHSRAGDLCARLGGDEFAVWLEDTGTGGAETKARHLMEEAKLLHKHVYASGDEGVPKLGLSIGISIADPGFQEQLPQLIKRADDVMYQIKRNGKGGLMVAPGMPQEDSHSE